MGLDEYVIGGKFTNNSPKTAVLAVIFSLKMLDYVLLTKFMHILACFFEDNL